MVWCCMIAQGPGTLFPQNSTYQCIKKFLNVFMMPSSRDLCKDDFVFQQNSAFSNTSKSITKWFQEQEISVLSQPSKSSDHREFVRKYEKMISGYWTKSKKKNVISSFKNIWTNFDKKKVCEFLVNNIPNPFRAVIKV